LRDIFRLPLPFGAVQAFIVVMLILFPWLTGRPELVA